MRRLGCPPEVTPAQADSGWLWLVGGVDAGGSRCDVAVDQRSGLVAEVAPALDVPAGGLVEDCAGLVLLPAPVEPHAHLDKALSSDGVAGRGHDGGGDLSSAIASWQASVASIDPEEIARRATVAAEAMVVAGTVAIRSHVGVGPGPDGLRALGALVEVRADLARRELADLQLVAMAPGSVEGAGGLPGLLEAAAAVGADLIGGCPYREPDPVAATGDFLACAGRLGLPVDLHTDETLDPAVLTIVDLVRLVGEHGPGGGVTASHCVSLGVQEPTRQEQIAADLAGVGVSVVTLPQTNLYLQGRGVTKSTPRGLTAVRPLLEAGVTLAAGADNVRDPFCHLGRLDAVETAALLVLAGHLSPSEAWTACSCASRRVLGLPAAGPTLGAVADLLCIEGKDLTTALAGAGQRRTVLRSGRVVARTTVVRHLVAAGDRGSEAGPTPADSRCQPAGAATSSYPLAGHSR